MRLDAHQHFWKFNPSEYSWMQPDWPIRRDFLPPDLHPLLMQTGFEGSIAVQARQSMEETDWLLDLANEQPFIKAVVGWVDLRSERVEEELARLASHATFAGVRHVVQDEPDDRFMDGTDFRRGIGKLTQFNLTYDLLVFARQLSAAIRLVSCFPEQRFVLDHMGKPDIKQGTISPWREQLIELGKHPNVMCKISGLVTEANWHNWTKAEFQPFLEVALEAFGMSRLMFGSDWPVCLLAGSYAQVFGLVQDFLTSLSIEAKAQIFGGNAERFYLQRGGSIQP
jgi:L-fuconolactonase